VKEKNKGEGGGKKLASRAARVAQGAKIQLRYRSAEIEKGTKILGWTKRDSKRARDEDYESGKRLFFNGGR